MAAAARLEEFNPLDMASEGLRIIGMELLSVMMCCKVDSGMSPVPRRGKEYEEKAEKKGSLIS